MKNRDKPKRLVGIGASAGGLEAIEQLISSLSNDSNLAFVIIQHLSPDFRSLMDDLLGRFTSMKINRAEEGMEIMRNQIYLIPPGKLLRVKNNCLHLSEKKSDKTLEFPIDVFFWLLYLSALLFL